MSMNKTKIEWCDYTWSPVTGCKHGCSYCYARKIAERFKGSKAWPQGFEPMFHPDRLDSPRHVGTQYYNAFPKGSTVFVCSMADLFGSWVPDEWITRVMDAAVRVPRHTYIFLTKNPSRYLFIPGSYLDQKNFWFGTTVTGGDRPSLERVDSLRKLPAPNKFISFEPLLCGSRDWDLTGIRQVIVGAQTNPFYPVQVSWIKRIEDEADRVGAKVFVKDSLKDWMGNSPLFRRELQWPLNKAPEVSA